MADLIPFELQTAADLDQKLAGTPFRSTDDFINFYNSGLINKTADEVIEFAQAVDSTFKNVKLQGKNLVFISKEEVELNEAIRELRKWEIVAKVRDRVSNLAGSGKVGRNTKLVFSEDSVGTLESLVEGEDGVTRERLFDEKFFKPADEELAHEAVRQYSSTSEPGTFLVGDFADLDVSFVSDVHSILFSE